MNMIHRNHLINELDARGFKEGKAQDFGWTFTHRDGFVISFDAGGRFNLVLPDGIRHNGVMAQPNDVLSLIDKAAESL